MCKTMSDVCMFPLWTLKHPFKRSKVLSTHGLCLAGPWTVSCSTPWSDQVNKRTHYPTVEQVAQGHPWSETFELSARVSWYFSTALTLILNMFNMLFSMGVEVWLSAGSQLFVCQNFELLYQIKRPNYHLSRFALTTWLAH